MAIVVAAVCALTWLVTVQHDLLPKIYLDRTHLSPTANFAAAVVVTTPALAQPPAPSPANPWFTAAPLPEPSEEVLGAPIGGKLYGFSGLGPGFRPRDWIRDTGAGGHIHEIIIS